ncbi:FemAB family XrtA/PEP-CTERM system-associated protein [Sphingomonas flavalba]|uniref:FemAB family XrtA/PEP-CTERM system-associated protein n=1 Tax=Sphingomonas flavalba TaxID=2559804 RepID=UPI00109DB4CC|nr:FemAB family XrtA/PEP-CTERM system-associated protein [Sphingomonas flavalba]
MSAVPAIRAVVLDAARETVRIDAFVRDHPDSTPFHLTGWGRAVAEGCGQRAHMLVAEAGGAIVGVLPLTEVRSRLFGRALVSSGFAVGGGILALSDAAAMMLAEAGWALAGRLGCPSLELRGGALPTGATWRIDDSQYAGFARPLAADDDAEMLAIPRKQRAELRRALAGRLRVVVGRDAAALDAHYAVYAESVRNLGTPVFPRSLFRFVIRNLQQDSDIISVYDDAVPVASVLSLYHRGTVMPYWGGGTHRARAIRANDLLYFALMRHARERGCTWFDFGRSKPGTGAFAFKKNWGFAPVPLRYATRTAPGAAARAINPLSPRYRMQVALWRRLPLALANRIGPPIARGLG